VNAFRSRIVHVIETAPLDWVYFEDGVLLVQDGIVRDIGPAERFEKEGFDLSQCDWRPNDLLIPGFIDTHVHSPQIDVIASWSPRLLDWLDRYTFPAELKFADEAYATAAADDFINGLLAAGTTTAMVFVTSFLAATDALFEAARMRGMRLIAGKVLMDQNVPAALCDTAQQGVDDSRYLIEKWHGKDRLGYAVSPRFAISSSRAQLRAAGDLFREFPGTWIQTHLSEDREEIARVREVHPYARDYLDVYEQNGLVNDRAVFGHGLYLSDSELERLATAGGKLAFCPSSNLFLGSGLLDMERIRSAGVDISIATDVGGGTGLSMLKTLGDAYKVCQLRGYSLEAMDAFAMATLGNARAMGLDSCIGNLEPGKEADFIFLSPPDGSILGRRLDLCLSVEEELFVYMMLGDEGVISETFVGGRTMKRIR
jgi:guanine deaminase